MKKILSLILTLSALFNTSWADISWSAPTAISTALTDASDPHVVIDASNNATAIWVEGGLIKSSIFPNGGSWSAPVTLSNVLNTSSNPKIALDGSGNVTAIWIENNVIESATLAPGGSWSAETSPISGSGATTPVLAVDSSGNAVAVWVRSGFIESSTRKSGVWSLVSVLSATDSDNPSVTISDFGIAMAGWHSVIAGADQIVTNILTISTNTWGLSKNVLFTTGGSLHNYPKVRLDANGNAVVVWYKYRLLDGAVYENVEVLTSALSNGATAWVAIPTILTSLGQGIRNPADLKIAVRYDSSEDALAFWTNSYDGQTFSLEESTNLFGQTWQTSIEPVLPTIYTFSYDVSVSRSTALLVNSVWDGMSSILIQSQESSTNNPFGSAWTISQTISTGADNAYPSCSLSSSGSTLQGAAVWVHFDGTNNVIHASTGAGTLVTPPTSVSATQNLTDFGVYQDYFNTITWTDSTEGDVVQYNIYRNGILFAQALPGTGQVIDHNETQGGTVIYGVAAYTSDHRQSDIVNFTLNP